LRAFRVEKININQALKARGLLEEHRTELLEEKIEIDGIIDRLVEQQKVLKGDLSEKRKALAEAKSALSKTKVKKRKIELPTVASIEALFEDYNISPASYHGGKLNGVDCREVLGRASELFPQIRDILLAVQHDDRAPEEIIVSVLSLHRDDIYITLDCISSKMRMNHGAPREAVYEILEQSLLDLDFLWRQAGLSFTPKMHGRLCHAFQQMKWLGGFGYLLEDN